MKTNDFHKNVLVLVQLRQHRTVRLKIQNLSNKIMLLQNKSNMEKYSIKQIKDYFIQCCAYAIAHNELYGTGIKNVVILITVDGKDPQCFETSAVPFLPELKNRRNQYDLL